MDHDATLEPSLPSAFQGRRREYERVIVALMAAGASTAVLGGLAHFFHPPLLPITIWIMVGGLLLLSAAIHLADPLLTLRTLVKHDSGGTSYDRLKRYNRLKAASVSLNLLTIVSTIFILGAYLSRIDLFEFGPVANSFLRSITFVSATILCNFAYVFFLSLRTPLSERRPRSRYGLLDTLLIGGLLFGSLGGLLTQTPFRLGYIELGPQDSAFLLLTAVTLLSVGLFVSRALPTVYSLFSDRSEYYKSAYESRNRMIVLPSLVAFTLLFSVLILASLFELGSNRIIITLRSNTFIVGMLGFIGIALAVGLWVSFRIARMEDRLPLYRSRVSAQQRNEWIIIGGSGFIALLFVAAALWLTSGHSLPYLGMTEHDWPEAAAFAIMAATGPYGFYYAHRLARVRRLEQRFPDLLRDIAASRKAGLTLPASVTIAAGGAYGELTPEIRKMADQLSLNVPFDEALSRFGDRVDTPLVRRDVLLINQAGKAGGQITDVLEAAAADAREVKTLENERRSTMSLYTIVIYIIFAVFLVVISILHASFIPPFLQATQATRGENLGGITFHDLTIDKFRTFYFVGGLVQAVGNGFIAGLFESGRALSGLRHSFVMVLITYIAFVTVLN